MKKVVSLFSGGIDSTATTYRLADEGYEVYPVYYYGVSSYSYLEVRQMYRIWVEMNEKYLNVMPIRIVNIKIPPNKRDRRNRIFLDLTVPYAKEIGCNTVAIGEYKGGGEETWVCYWMPFPMEDADTEKLKEYIKKLDSSFNLITLDDFGPCLYKSDRINIGKPVLGDTYFLTTCCQSPAELNCGNCYKDVERHVGFLKSYGYDKTPYVNDPKLSRWFPQYCVQMNYFEGLLQTENWWIEKERVLELVENQYEQKLKNGS